MTAPVTGITPVYGLEYLVEGEPVKYTRQKLERNAKTVEAALVAGGLTPPGASDYAALVGRVTALENRSVMRRWYSGSTTTAGTVSLNQTDFTRGSDIVASGTGIKVTKAGLYHVAAVLNFVGGTSNARTGLITVNGANVRQFGNPSTDSRASGGDYLNLAANDVVGLATYTGGTTPTLNGATAQDVSLTVAYVRA